MSSYSVRKFFGEQPPWYVCKHVMTLDGAAMQTVASFDTKEEADNLKLQLDAQGEHDRRILKIAFVVVLVLALVGTGGVITKWLHDHCAVNVCEEDVGG
jgi:hypothetical protein